MSEYNPKEIEPKWQKKWEEEKLYESKTGDKREKYYSLMEFPYPSGDGLHTGHVRGYTAMDIISRKRRMQGKNVMFPIGWDAFGLPTENYALKTGKDPRVVTKENTDNFRKQFKSLGLSFDWSREINTTDPKYYKWTQWIFLKFLEKGLAYKDKQFINWCPKDKIGLANEEVVNGRCERCGTPVEKREKEQWMLAITKYADRLEKDLESLDYSERIKLSQKNWIGRSEGAEIEFDLTTGKKVKVFTTRPDTIFGATYLVLAPEHPLILGNLAIKNYGEVEDYINKTRNKAEVDRVAEGKEKTGVEIQGLEAINPATKEKIPVWIADYVLPNYGAGAIMAVPAHDGRDYDFATKFKLPIKEVIEPVTGKVLPDEQLRNSIVAIVENPKTGEILTLDWTPKYGGVLFIGGGLEGEEDPVEAAIREIKEETGYKNLKLIQVAGKSHHHYFAFSKNVARNIEVTGLHFELTNEEREEPKLEENEKNLFTVHWLTKDDAAEKVVDENHALLFQKFIRNKPYTGTGLLTNSGKFDGKNSEEVYKDIIKFAGGTLVTKFRLRDWVFSRQRYWGEPIPVIHCEKCGTVPVPESDLPVELPVVEKYEPGPDGESPLANVSDWVNVKCPKCEGQAKRETDVMPNWAGSSWYFLRYADPENDKEFASKKALKYWMPVDWYNGGMEHTTLHLLYSRFWNKFLYDLKLVPTDEPYKKRTSHGLILAEGGEKMSKSKGNVINPDEIVKRFGADTLRLYEMFMGSFDQAIAWSEDALVGPYRFIERVWKLSQKFSLTKSSDVSSGKHGQTSLDKTSALKNVDQNFNISLRHQTIKKVSEDIETMSFNTAISTLMIWVNALEKQKEVSQEEFKTLLLLIAPFAPHVTEELWTTMGEKNSIHTESWPEFDASKLESSQITVVVQVNGKVRGTLNLDKSTSEEEVKTLAQELPEVKKWLSGATIKRIVVVPGKLVNIVL